MNAYLNDFISRSMWTVVYVKLTLAAIGLIICLLYLFSYRDGPIRFLVDITKYFFWPVLGGLTFVLIQLLTTPVLPLPLGNSRAWVQIAGTATCLIGLILLIIAQFQLGNNWNFPRQPNRQSKPKLVTDGIFKYSRNPIYLAFILLLAGFELALASWLIMAVIPFGYWIHQVILSEERYLAQILPKEFQIYAQNTPRYFISTGI